MICLAFVVSRGRTLPQCITKSESVGSINEFINIKDAGENLQAFEDATLLIYGVIKI